MPNNPYQLIDQALKQYPEIASVRVLFSGGNDSLTVAHLAMQHPFVKEHGAIWHINTGIGIPETNQFARDTACKHGWKFEELSSKHYVRRDGTPDPQSYENIVLKYGFPGPAQHSIMYRRLKERVLSMGVRDLKLKRKQKVMLISGVRQQESQRRMGWAGAIHQTKSWVWVNICIDWSNLDCYDYRKANDIEQSSVAANLCMSGECTCGAFAEKNEFDMIANFYPEWGDRIEKLEKEVMKQFPWKWESRPPAWWLKEKKGQCRIPGLDLIESELMLPMCSSCIHQKTGLDSYLKNPVQYKLYTNQGIKQFELFTLDFNTALAKFTDINPGFEVTKVEMLV